MFPWDTLADAAATARAHPDGIVDLSVGTPVDEVAPVIRTALAQAAAASGYPLTAGTPALRASAVAALARRYGITGVAEHAVLPVIGTKELIAWLPTLVGLGADDTIVIPELAYPTYEVGARVAGAQVIAADSLTQLGPLSPAVVYLNSPSNPTGSVYTPEEIKALGDICVEKGVLIMSDEIYEHLTYDGAVVKSVATFSQAHYDHTIIVHGFAKAWSMTGWRLGFLAAPEPIAKAIDALQSHSTSNPTSFAQKGGVAALNGSQDHLPSCLLYTSDAADE